MTMVDTIAGELFVSTFGDAGDAIRVTAPGRVNLIGEHTDYNHGYVMPCALERRTSAVARLTKDGTSKCQVVTAFAPEEVKVFTLDDTSDSLVAGKDDSWLKYVKGVVSEYFAEVVASKPLDPPSGKSAVGFQLALASDVPLGGGLSSSASLEVCVALMLQELYNIRSVSNVDRALRCVEAEHKFANVPCGIMDQFISSCAVEGCALLIDCRTYKTVETRLDDPNLSVVITNSNKTHSLSGSEYPDRVRQCNEAVKIVSSKFAEDGKSRTHLRDVTLEELEACKDLMDEVVYKRALHGVSEDIRTLAAVKAAEAKDYKKFGQLMVESHNSLRDNFEVSTPQIDFLVATAIKLDGVYGSRITGGGFGGCTVSLVAHDKADAVIAAIKESYKKEYGIDTTPFATKLGPGARVL